MGDSADEGGGGGRGDEEAEEATDGALDEAKAASRWRCIVRSA